MFTGIVERTASVDSVSEVDGSYRLVVKISGESELRAWRPAEIGESIAIDGACLTVVSARSLGGAEVAFDVVPETLKKTSFENLNPGDVVNVERSLAAGDLFGGHYVTGHVDGVGEVRDRRAEGGQILFEISAPKGLIAQILPKGSISVDGVSLTVIDVERAENWFSFAAIPHTMQVTSLRDRQPGDSVNLETDAFGKWAVHTLSEIVGSGARHEQLHRLLDAAGWVEQKTPNPGSA